MAERTPTTELIRQVWADYHSPEFLPAFDRWLAQERAEAGAQALEQAADDLYSDDGPGNPLSTTTWLRERAALIRGGDDQ